MIDVLFGLGVLFGVMVTLGFGCAVCIVVVELTLSWLDGR